MWQTIIWGCEYFPSVIFVSLHWSVTLVYFIFCDNYSGNDILFFFLFFLIFPCIFISQVARILCFFCVCLICHVVLPGRLCDGPSSLCRLQATSCWAPPATLSSCWRRRRREQRRACHCHRRAGSGSCRACCWARYPIDDGLQAYDGAKTHTQKKQEVTTCSCQSLLCRHFRQSLPIVTL